MNYEIHITCSVYHSAVAEQVAKTLHWKTSEIARDPVLGKATYFYLTTHTATLEDAHIRMEACCAALETEGVPVIREKIEHIVHDRRYV